MSSRSSVISDLRFFVVWTRAVERSENPGMPVSLGGHNLAPLVEVGLTDLPKFGGANRPGDFSLAGISIGIP